MKSFITNLLIALIVFNGAFMANAYGIVSDDFSSGTLNTAVWTLVNPLGDVVDSLTGTHFVLKIPAGTNHDPWTSGNTAPRLMQDADNINLGIEVKFDSYLRQAFQDQGLIVQESASRYLRFDVVYDGTHVRAYSALLDGATVDVKGDTAISLEAPMWLRVNRVGNNWTYRYSQDGTNWVTVVSFTQYIAVTSVGFYGGNVGLGEPAPSFMPIVDYFFDTSSPIIPEDAGSTDVTAPIISNVAAAPGVVTSLVTWNTNEFATSRVDYGLDLSYGDFTEKSGMTSDHQVLLEGLVPNTIYYYKVTSTDGSGNSTTSTDGSFQTEPDYENPVIEVFHSWSQKVGHLGNAQDDFNLIGNVTDESGISSLTYSLNGGEPVALNVGSRPDGFGDGRRLAKTGDFNADIPISSMTVGANTIRLRARDNADNLQTLDISVELQAGSYPTPVNIDWTQVSYAQDWVQYVDGKWGIIDDELRIFETGYDRMVLIGEKTWQDYEITVPVTIYKRDVVTGPHSGPPGVGIRMRFTGHVVDPPRFPEDQPKWGYQPVGATGWLRWDINGVPQKQYYRGDIDEFVNYGEFPITYGQTYVMKMRCQTLPDAANGNGITRYSWKIWEEGQMEPLVWDWEVEQESSTALRRGGLTLLAHHLEIGFGQVSVNLINNPPQITSDPVLTAVENQLYEYQVTAEDLDIDDSMTFGLEVAPSWLTIDEVSGLISGTPGNADVGDTTVTVFVEDSKGDSAKQNYTLTVSNVNDGPVISALPAFSFNEDESLIIPISDWYSWVEDIDNPDEDLTYEVIEGNHLSVQQTTESFTLSAPGDWYGLDTLTLAVSDGELADSSDFVVEVHSLNDVPLLIDLPDTVKFKNTESYIMEMWLHVQDIETPVEEMSWTFDVSVTAIQYQFNDATGELTLQAPGYLGVATFYCTVEDDSLAAAVDSFYVKVTGVSSIEDLQNIVPERYVLDQNYPNPFNPETSIRFGLPVAGEVRIEVYNALGERIAVVYQGKKPAGYHEVFFDAGHLPSGVYFYRIQANSFTQVKKMILMK